MPVYSLTKKKEKSGFPLLFCGTFPSEYNLPHSWGQLGLTCCGVVLLNLLQRQIPEKYLNFPKGCFSTFAMLHVLPSVFASLWERRIEFRIGVLRPHVSLVQLLPFIDGIQKGLHITWLLSKSRSGAQYADHSQSSGSWLLCSLSHLFFFFKYLLFMYLFILFIFGCIGS